MAAFFPPYVHRCALITGGAKNDRYGEFTIMGHSPKFQPLPPVSPSPRLLWWVVLALALGGCMPAVVPGGQRSLNSRYTDEQPALSADGRFLALISNRNGRREIFTYDLQQKQLVDLSGLNRFGTMPESPSLSYTARYIVYLTTSQARPALVMYDRILGQGQILYQPYEGSIRHPRVSPDGRYIVFETSMRGQWDVAVIDRGPNIELDVPDGLPLEEPITP